MPRSKEGFLWTPQTTTNGLETEAVIQSSKIIQFIYDVVVIGSGFAGLIAARNLAQDSTLRVLLVEARDRIGGRTWTAKAFGEEFEMGGTWIHWNQPHLYHELHRYGLHRYLRTSAGTLAPEKYYFKPAYAPVREVPPEQSVAALERIAEKFFSIDGLDSRALMPFPHEPFREPAVWRQYDHLTVKLRLDQLDGLSQFEKDIFESNVATFGSAPGSDIGFTEALRWFALGGHSMAGVFERAGIYKLGNGGMTAFAWAILQDFQGDVLLNTIVEKIDQDRTGVSVQMKDGRRIDAKAVVSTIPLNCLGDITFNPPLSALKTDTIASGHINKGTKIYFNLAATEPGWFATCGASGESPYVFAFSDHNGHKPSGPRGTWCIGFGRNVCPGAEIQAYLTHDWMNDPYAKGTWSCWGPNQSSRYVQELQKADGRVFFASADWADGWRGFVDGAIERGQKSANDVKTFMSSKHSAKL